MLGFGHLLMHTDEKILFLHISRSYEPCCVMRGNYAEARRCIDMSRTTAS